MQSTGKIKLVVMLAALFFAVIFLHHTIKKNKDISNEIEQHNNLVAEVTECIDYGDWKCAEKDIRKLLEESPNDKNLHLHLAGILFEQERYQECIRFVDSLGYSEKDFEFLKKKSEMLLREMSELKLETSKHFRLEFEGRPSRNDVLEALSVLEVAYDSICRLFDFHPENKMHLVLYQSSAYQGIGPRPDWVGAVFDGKLRVPANVMQYRDVYRPMLFHELTHAFVRAMTRAKVPLWLNEGIAQVVDASRNDVQKPFGSKPDLNSLTEPFVNQSNTDEAVKLYWYSQKMVESLLYRNGATYGSALAVAEMKKLRACIQDLRSLGTDGALQKHFGVTSAQLLEKVN